ncbi:MAG: glycosyltransferase family 39 protein, partial [Candidatus Hydrogenedentota bacterium]
VTYFLGGKMLGSREAFLGAAIMATSAHFLWIGRIGVIDMLLTLCILVSLSLFYVGYAEKRPLFYVAGFFFFAPAALSKGPAGVAVPLVVMLVFLIVEVILRKEGSPKQLAWFAACAILGLMIVAVFVAPWWRAAYERSGGAYGSLSALMKQTQGRIFESYSHRRPFYYYFVNILWQFMPWTVFFPLAVWTVKEKGNLRGNLGLRFLAVWFSSVLLFFTLISGKRSQYILPLFPAVGIILGWALANSDPEGGRLRERREFSIPLLLVLLLAAVGLIALMPAAYLYAQEHFSATATGALASAVALAVLSRQCVKRPPRTALACVVTATTLTVAVVFGYLAPLVDRYKSARPFCSAVLSALQEGEPLFFYKVYRPNVHYYMRRRMPELESNEDVRMALERSRGIFLVMRSRHEELLDLGDAYEIGQVDHARIGSRDMLCVVVRPARKLP